MGRRIPPYFVIRFRREHPELAAPTAPEPTPPPGVSQVLDGPAVAAPAPEPEAVLEDTGPPVAMEALPEIERYLKGEVHFLHLEPEPSRDEYWEFRDRDDDLGRVAWQRLMIIRINAFQMVDDLFERDIPRYNERFGIRADDRYGITFPLQRTAQLLADRGDAGQALDLVAGHVRRHDRFDAPYSAYALPGQFFELASENGRADEYGELTNWVLEGLDAEIERRLQNPADEGPKASGIPGEIFFSLFADRKLDSHEWTGEFLKLRHRIAEGVATARGRLGQ